MQFHILHNAIRPPMFKFAPDEEAGGGAVVDADQKSEEKPKSLEDFNKRFSAATKAPLDQGGKPDSEQIKLQIENDRANKERQEKQSAEQKAHSEEVRKKAEEKSQPPFIKQQIERARTAEAERDALKAKAEEVEKTNSTLQQQIAELNQKIEKGVTESKEKEYTDKIAALEQKISSNEETLVNENRAMRERLKAIDLANDPDFVKEYVQPVVTVFTQLREMVGADQKANQVFQRAIAANLAAMQASKPEDRIEAETQRDQLFTTLVEGMPEFTRTRFVAACGNYLELANKHCRAIQEGEKTRTEVERQRAIKAEKAAAERMDTWGKTYKAVKDNYADEEKLTKEEIEKLKELKIPIEEQISKAEKQAHETVMGKNSVMEGIEVIHRGRVQVVTKAKLALAEHRVKELETLVAKLRNGGTKGGNSNGQQEKKPDADEKQTREQFHGKFAASRIVRTA